MITYKHHISPLLNRLDSERMHKATVALLHHIGNIPGGCRLLGRQFHPTQASAFRTLHTRLATLDLNSPVMVGAGWDKEARAVTGLICLGFAAVEIGGVVEHPQYGRPKPRQFVIGPGVVLNRMGFNSPGMAVVRNNLKRYLGKNFLIGANVARNENLSDDQTPHAYARVVDALFDYCAYFSLNVSCPNTPNFLHLQEKAILTDIIAAVHGAMDRYEYRKPVFIKISPDLTRSALDDIIRVAMDNRVDGIVATNTSVCATLKGRYGARWKGEAGGFSGDDDLYRQMTLQCIAHVYRETGGALPIIGVGGVKDGTTALQKIQAGATAVQVVTAMRGEGLGVAYRIKCELVAWMERHGVSSLDEVRGVVRHGKGMKNEDA